MKKNTIAFAILAILTNPTNVLAQISSGSNSQSNTSSSSQSSSNPQANSSSQSSSNPYSSLNSQVSSNPNNATSAGASIKQITNYNNDGVTRVDNFTNENSNIRYSGGTNNQNNTRYSGSYSIRNVPDVVAPALTTTLTETCMGSTSVGGAGVGFGVSFGTTWRDTACVRRLDARQLLALGHSDAATELMCDSEAVQGAFRRVGRPCAAEKYNSGTTYTSSPRTTSNTQVASTSSGIDAYKRAMSSCNGVGYAKCMAAAKKKLYQ